MYRFEKPDGTPYRPSNGTEGMIFEDNYCSRCRNDVRDDCEILLRSMLFSIGDDQYPDEWQWQDGDPACTAFEPKDGGHQ